MGSDAPETHKQEPPQPDVFDVGRVRELIELMRTHDLSEIDLRSGERRIRLRRGPEAVAPPAAAPVPVWVPSLPPGVAPSVPATTVQPPAPSQPPARESETLPPPKEENITYIRSPMVGTFYASPDPDSPPYVKVGDHVNPETIVGIVEAMKVFNELPAEISGKIVAVLVENGEPVEYGQPLFKVDTQG
ncbi:acetyl-CoA carboxylase biotin carboxyl carrier protein [Thermogutta sp.]|uniref:acetyl-CoA carboxylase biotin carboxyl carrier protein n=1 Tax=Thermogutta sp. TaxID=1962930 RepID=UPI0032203B0E